jgi:hypothetical protein
MEECDKCGYKSSKNREIFGKFLCEFCAYFAPTDKENFLIYCQEKVDSREIQTYRKQNKMGGIRQKNSMQLKAKKEKIMSRAPFGYKIVDGKIIRRKQNLLLKIFMKNF